MIAPARLVSSLFTTALLAAVVLTGIGCAPQLDRIEVAVQYNHDEMTLLKAENKRLLQEVAGLGQLLRMDRNAGDESSAMRFSRLSQLSTQIDQLMNKLDDNTEYMRDLSARVDLLATRSGLPTLGKYKPPSGGPGTGSPLLEQGKATYDMALLDRNRGNTELARQGFLEFLEKFPSSEVADDALFWLGDLAYSETKFEQSLGYFQQMLTQYPAAEFAPAALYKSRRCLLELNRQDEAWDVGGKLLTQFPNSDEAAMLKEETGQ